MADRTYDVKDPRDLPYDFAFSPITDRVYAIWFTPRGMIVSEMFESRAAFHRYLMECNETDLLIANRGLNENGLRKANDILKKKQEGED